ncbi:MAG: hypothetical protein AVDCRST_MAG23-657, partial [uncultured Sphingosinicella sp.]
ARAGSSRVARGNRSCHHSRLLGGDRDACSRPAFGLVDGRCSRRGAASRSRTYNDRQVGSNAHDPVRGRQCRNSARRALRPELEPRSEAAARRQENTGRRISRARASHEQGGVSRRDVPAGALPRLPEQTRRRGFGRAWRRPGRCDHDPWPASGCTRARAGVARGLDGWVRGAVSRANRVCHALHAGRDARDDPAL